MESAHNDLIQRIQVHYGNLRPAERIVADYLRNNAGTRLDASITEFARTLGVSEATISRVSRALGYDGYPSLKLSVAEETKRSLYFTNLPIGLEETDSMVTLSDKFSLTLANSLRETHKMLDADRLERVVQSIANASMTVFIGVGGAASICDEAVHMLLKAGIDSTSYRDGYSQIVASSTMTPNRTMVGISHTGQTETVAAALAHARSKGAMTIAITSDPTSEVAKAAEIQLITWHRPAPEIPLFGDFLEGRICQLYLIDLIYLGLLFHTGKQPRDNLKATGLALERYYLKTNRKDQKNKPLSN